MATKKRGSESPARRVRYSVAMSLDGYIAAADGGYDWIVMDPEIDFAALYAEFDAFLMGRKTYEATAGMMGGGKKGTTTLVFSRTLRQKDHKKVTIVADDPAAAVAALKAEPGKDIWLFGGGELFASFLDAGLVDGVEVAVVPVLLGSGVPLLGPTRAHTKLALTGHRVLKTSGIVQLTYAVA